MLGFTVSIWAHMNIACAEIMCSTDHSISSLKNIDRHEIYIVGSLANIPAIQEFASKLRHQWFCECDSLLTVNDSWTAHGSTVDEEYWKYCLRQGYDYTTALHHDVAKSVFNLDKSFIERADAIIMIQPCGKSAALELGYAAGRKKFTCIIKEEPATRIEVMENFADIVYPNKEIFFRKLSSFEEALNTYKIERTISMSTN